MHPGVGRFGSAQERERSECDAYRYLAGEAEAGGGALLLAVVVVVVAAARAHGAAARHLAFPPLVGRLSGRLGLG